MMASLAWWAYAICLAYLTLITLVFAFMIAVAVFENRLRSRELSVEDFDTLLASPFTIPVSVIVPVYNETACAQAVVDSLLALDYPEFEVIVVNDGSTDATLASLDERFVLEPTGTFYRRSLEHAPMRSMYRSRLDSRLTVLDKVNGGKADALNCGINVARYRYVFCVDGDTMYSRDTLLKGMRLIMRDPQRAVGVTSQIVVSGYPERALTDAGQLRLDRSVLMVYQTVDYLRAFATNRLAWSRGNFMLCSSGAFSIWRRDVVLRLGGFSPRFTCEDIEFTFRVHEHFRATNTPYRIYSLADPLAVTEGPTTAAGLIAQRARWQRVINETVSHYRRMLFNPRYGTVGLIGLPYYLIGEVLAPVFQTLSVLAIPLAVVAGVLSWPDFIRMMLILALLNGILTNAAVLMLDRGAAPFSLRHVAYIVLLGPLELFLYRPVIFVAQLKGLAGYMRGDRAWNKVERNRR